MNSLRPTIQRVTVAAARRYKSTTAPTQGVHNLSPQSAVPVRFASFGFDRMLNEWINNQSYKTLQYDLSTPFH